MSITNMGIRRVHRFLNGPPDDPLTYVHPYVSPVIRAMLKQIPESVEMLMLWGSSVKDYMRDDSDIDLIIIPNSAKHDVWELLDSLSCERYFDTIAFDSYEEIVRQSKDCFPGAVEVLRTAIPIYKKNGKVRMV